MEGGNIRLEELLVRLWSSLRGISGEPYFGFCQVVLAAVSYANDAQSMDDRLYERLVDREEYFIVRSPSPPSYDT